MKQILVYRTLSTFYALFAVGTIFSLFIGYYLALFFHPISQLDLLSFLGSFLFAPIVITLFSSYIGWRQKKSNVDYSAPEWKTHPVQMTIEDARRLPRAYNRRYYRLVANSNYWMFFIPILLIILILALPLYSYYEDSRLSEFIPLINAIGFGLLFSISLFGSFSFASNHASVDFTLPLIREAVKLARYQEKVSGVCQVRIVLDKAEGGDLTIYDSPRVVIRIEGLENDAYVESWSDDLRAITRVLCRLYEKDGKPQVIWWWFSTDRNFRKFIHPDENGYYVKNPVRTNISKLGVKDITLVTKNAVALIVKEYIETHGESEALRFLLTRLGAENP